VSGTVGASVGRISERDQVTCLEQAERAFRELRGEQVLVTGGTGFVGRWLLETFAWANRRMGLGSRLTVLTRDPDRFRAAAPHLAADDAIRLVQGDVRSFAAPAGTHAFAVHAATAASKALNDSEPLEMMDVVYAGTRRALDVAAEVGCSRFLMTSSGAVYGAQPPGTTHLAEDFAGGPDVTQPRSAYAESKRLAELLCVSHPLARRAAVVLPRGFAFVGPYLPLDVHFAMGNFVRDALAAPAVTVEGDGEPFRSYMYAADLAAWLWVMLAFGRPGRAYNVGSESGLALRDVAAAVASAVGKPVHVRGLAVPGAPPQRYVPSTARAREELGLEERVPLADAVRRTLAFHGAAGVDVR
jgi:nucleoside-diphosphate-sugar epimerase